MTKAAPQTNSPPPKPSPDVTGEGAKRRLPFVRDDVAYVAPMLTFLAFTYVGGTWPALYPASYVVKTLATAALLVAFRGHYTKISWRYWWLGAIVGVVGIFQWVGMQLWLQHHFEFFRPGHDAFDPTKAFASAATRDAFIAFRWAGAVLLVPVMEELFWRDFLWRTILAPNDFKLARVGEWGWAPFLGVALAFSTVHGNWGLTAVVWALMVGGLLVVTGSLGACIVAHAVTNLLLGGYVLWTKDWSFW